MSNMDIYDKFKVTPDNAKKTIKGGRISGFTDINPMYRIMRLTEMFGPCGIGWYYTVDRKWTEQAGEEILCFVDISLYIKIDGEWSKPIAGTGGNTLLAKETKGLKASDECYKMAATDAISVACKQLGVGADVYWQGGESKYDTDSATEPITPAGKRTITAEVLARGQQIDALIKKYNMTREEYTVIVSATKAKSPADMTADEFSEHLALVQQRFEALK